MRPFTGKFLETCRLQNCGAYSSDRTFGFNGAFVIPHNGARLTVIASDGMGWDHVSVSLPDRCPTWEEMAYVKSLFWDEHECVMQLHPPRSAYVNNHPYCLHLWKPQGQVIPQPPTIMVGPLGAERKEATAT